MVKTKKDYQKIYRKANRILDFLIGSSTLNSSELGSMSYGDARKVVIEIIKS